MSDYVNTVDSIGDAAICKSILHKTLDAITDTYCEMVGGYAFYGFPALHTAIFANAKRIEQYAFAHCSKLETIKVPLSENVGYFSFYECEKLKEADFPCVTSVSTYAFKGCIALKTLILRSGTLATLSGVNALGDTPIEKGKGCIYVPSALIDSYKSATNWTTYANQFRVLEDYTVDGTITGEVDPTRCRVRFFDEDGTLLGYVMVPNGGNATYTGEAPTKEGKFEFAGWSPAPTNVTADMDCRAVFRYTGSYTRDLVTRSISDTYVNDRVTSIGFMALDDCDSLVSVSFPTATTIGQQAFCNCNALTVADFKMVATIETFAFYNSTKLETLILRNSAQVVTCTNTVSALYETAISSGTGYIYVPASLLSAYKTHDDWSTFTNQFRAIEDYPEICGGDA